MELREKTRAEEGLDDLFSKVCYMSMKQQNKNMEPPAAGFKVLGSSVPDFKSSFKED